MSLREQMLQAGLISKKEAKQADHGQRVQSKKQGHAAQQQAKEQSRAEVRQQQQAEQETQARREQGRAQERAAQEQQQSARQRDSSAVDSAYAEGTLSHWQGQRRYYYARDTALDCVLVNDETGRKLEAGEAAIVLNAKGSLPPVLLTAGAARRLREVEPGRILLLHG